MWRFVGGEVEENESLISGAIRELKEELYIENLENIKPIGEYLIDAETNSGEIYSSTIYAFYLQTDQGFIEFNDQELSEIKFLDPKVFVENCKKNLELKGIFKSYRSEFRWSDFAKIYGDVQISMIEKVFWNK